MTKEIEKLELAILNDVFRYRRVVDLKLPIVHAWVACAYASKGGL